MDLPFAQGLMNKYNELHSWEHWYGVSEESQEDMCGVSWLMCGRCIRYMGNDECNAHILHIWHMQNWFVYVFCMWFMTL